MKIFLDTANVDAIEKYSFLIEGVTTNPSLLSKEIESPITSLLKILSLVDGDVSIEVNGTQCEEIIRESIHISSLGNNAVVKIPMTLEGLKAVRLLKTSKATSKIRVNITLVFSLSQALLAALAGADFVSIFVGRLDDNGIDGMDVVREIRTIFDSHNIKTKIITASVRNLEHVTRAASYNSDIVTISPKTFEEMYTHDLTDLGLKKFQNDTNKK